jgi:hypothetical protein
MRLPAVEAMEPAWVVFVYFGCTESSRSLDRLEGLDLW